MDCAHKNGVAIRSTCNGMPSCAECRVRVTDGDYNCNPPSRKELSLIGTGYYIDQRRLSCQLLCFGDVTIDTTEQVEKVGEGPVTKKFLTKVHKSSAQESHSLGGVLIEQDGQLLSEIKKDVSDQVQPSGGGAGLDMREQKPRQPQGQRQQQGQRPPQQPGQPGEPRREGQGGRRRGRRGGRGRR